MDTDQQTFNRVLTAALAGDRQALTAFAGERKIDTLDNQGLSPVLHALHKNRLAAMQALIDAGAEVDAHDPALSQKVIDQTAFLYAGATGNTAP